MPQTRQNENAVIVPNRPSKKSRFHALLVLLVLAAIGFIIYGNTFKAPFIYDSVLNIRQNPHIRMDKISWDHIARIKHSTSPRPLSNFSFAVNYFLHRYNVSGYYFVNILIHILNAFLVFLITRQTIRLCHHQNHLIPVLVAVIWLVHPLHTQSVTYLVQRMTTLATLFYLLSLTCFIAARTNYQSQITRRPTRFYLLLFISGLSGLCGLAAKPIVASLPVIIFLYEWFFFQRLKCSWLKQKLFWIIGGLIIITAITFIYLGTDPVDHILRGYDHRHFTLMERLLTEPGIVIYYLSLLVFPAPSRLNLLYDFPVATSFTNTPSTALSFLALLVMIGGAIVIARKDRIIAFAILWFIVNLIMESSVIGLQLAFEHRTYLPSIFPVMAGVIWLYRHLRPAMLMILLISCTGILFGTWTWQRNITWQNKIRFWNDCAAKSPLRADVHNNLGQVLMEKDNMEQAIFHFKRAFQLDPDLSSAYTNMGVALSKTGKINASLKYHQKALELAPGNPQARYNLAIALKSFGKAELSIKQLEKTLDMNPYFAPAAFKLGVAWQEKGDYERALAYFQKARQLDPGNCMVYNNAGICLQALGDTQQAIQYYRQGLAIKPDDPRLHNSLGLALLTQGDMAKAAAQFKNTIQLNPDMAEPYNNLGLVALKKNDVDRAGYYFKQALAHNPDFFQAHINLADVWRRQKKPSNAIPHLKQAIKTAPDDLPALYRLTQTLADCAQYGQAMTVLEKIAALDPDNPTVAYNQACLYARQNQKQQAIKALQEAIRKGYDNWLHLAKDDDLDNIRNGEAYQALIEKIQPLTNNHGPMP